MSHKENTKYLDAKHEAFEQAMEFQHQIVAQRIIKDLKNNGFEEDAEALQNELQNSSFYCGECEGTGEIDIDDEISPGIFAPVGFKKCLCRKKHE